MTPTKWFKYQAATFETDAGANIFRRVFRRKKYHDRMPYCSYSESLVKCFRRARVCEIDPLNKLDIFKNVLQFSFGNSANFKGSYMFTEGLVQDLITIRESYSQIENVRWEIVLLCFDDVTAPYVTVRHSTRGWLIGAIKGNIHG